MDQANSSPFGKVKDTDKDKLREAYLKIPADFRKVSASNSYRAPMLSPSILQFSKTPQTCKLDL